jgi:hypothetical protein
MGIRIDASADLLKRTTSLPSATSVTMCGWFYIHTNRGAFYQVALIMEATGGSPWLGILWNNGTPNSSVIAGGDSTSTGFSATYDNYTGWVFLAVSNSGTSNNVIGYAARPQDSVFASGSGGTVGFTPVALYIGNSSLSEWLNGTVCTPRVWDAVLTEEELWQERMSILPVRTANLHLWAPTTDTVLANAQKDYSGNGRDLTAGGTLAVDGFSPPIPWRQGRKKYFIPLDGAAVPSIDLVFTQDANKRSVLTRGW